MITRRVFSKITVAIGAIAIAAPLVLSSSYVNAKTITLRWAEQTPPKGVRGEVVTWMTGEIAKRTEGRVKVEMHWGSSLVKRKEMLRGVMLGTADVGTVNVAFHPAQLRTWGLFNTFMRGPSDPDVVTWTKRKVFDTVPEFKAELEKWNQRYITFFNYLPSALALTEPITSTADMKGKRMRAPSTWLLAMLEAIGATPVSMPWGEVYVALQRGTIDGVLTSLDSYYRYSIDEVAKHYLYHKSQWQPQPILITINNDTWASIEPKDRDIILKIGQEANAMENRLNSTSWEECMEGMKKRSGAVFTEMSEAEINAWATMPAVAALPDRWVEEAKKAGYDNAQQIMETVRGIIQEGMKKEVAK